MLCEALRALHAGPRLEHLSIRATEVNFPGDGTTWAFPVLSMDAPSRTPEFLRRIRTYCFYAYGFAILLESSITDMIEHAPMLKRLEIVGK